MLIYNGVGLNMREKNGILLYKFQFVANGKLYLEV